ncbi:MAG: hypothetical protein AB7N54_15100 [Alphaproteobacteria bacterium]
MNAAADAVEIWRRLVEYDLADVERWYAEKHGLPRSHAIEVAHELRRYFLLCWIDRVRQRNGMTDCPVDRFWHTCKRPSMCNVTSWKPLSAVLAIATSLLAACATAPSDGAPCPPVVPYSLEFLARAADELERLPSGSASSRCWPTTRSCTIRRGRAGVSDLQERLRRTRTRRLLEKPAGSDCYCSWAVGVNGCGRAAVAVGRETGIFVTPSVRAPGQKD